VFASIEFDRKLNLFSTFKSKREPTVLPTRPVTGAGIMGEVILCVLCAIIERFLASVDELAFKKMPEVGPAPDMINDDLPTNLEYLDESFGAAAGLRELSDDDLEFDVEDAELNVTSISGTPMSGVVSRVGGETIKMLQEEGIHMLDNFYDTLPPETAGETATCVNHTLVVLPHFLRTYGQAGKNDFPLAYQ
jgi:autophagy-related protein 2